LIHLNFSKSNWHYSEFFFWTKVLTTEENFIPADKGTLSSDLLKLQKQGMLSSYPSNNEEKQDSNTYI